jgi:hypothetical protein
MDILKVLKIRSVENAVYDTRLNRMRFRIPSDNLNTHLSESYLSFQVKPIEANGTAVANTSNVGFGNAKTGLYYPTCLLKTVRLFRGDSNVPLEEVQNFNILDQNLKLYQKDMENIASDQFEGGFFSEDNFQSDKSPFWLEGETEVHIPLSDVFGICKNKDFYLSNVGGLQIEFELEDRYSLFIENIPDDIQQTVFTAFDPADIGIISTPSVSNKNKVYQSLTSNASDVAVDSNISVIEKQLQANPTNNNFYLAIDSATQAISDLSGTTDLYTLTLKVNPTQTLVTQSEGSFIAYGINSVTANTIFKTTDYKNVPVQIVFKKSATATLTSVEPIYGMSAVLTSYTDWSAGTPNVKAVITLTTPIQFNLTNNKIFALAFTQNLAKTSTTQRFIPIDASNNVSALIPKSLTNFGSNNPTLATIVTNNSGVFTLSTGNSTARTITINPLYFPAGITPVEAQRYEVYFQAHGRLNTAGTNLTSQIDYLGDKLINEDRYFRIAVNSSKRMQLLCTNATTGLFSIMHPKKDFPTTSVEIEAYNKVVDDAINSAIFAGVGGPTQTIYGEVYLRRLYDTTSSEYTAVEQSSLTYQIPRAELVLVQSAKQASDDVSKTYSTWKMEPTLIESATSNWQHQFILEPNSYNSLLLTPEALSGPTSTMISLLDGLNTYRWAIDNIDNTNRDVVINQALHHDKLIDTFNNGEIKIHNLVNDVLDDKQISDIGLIPMKIYTAHDNENVYMNNKSHTLQVALKSASGDVLIPKNIFLFKQVLKNM